MSADEIRSINKSFGGTVELNSTAETTLANAQNYNGFWNKAAVQVRDIAGGHMFDNGNKRTAQAVVETLMERNNIVTGVSSGEMRGVISQFAEGELRDIPSIASTLRGW